MRGIHLAAACLALSACSGATPARAGGSMCLAGERAVFACPTSSGIASVCQEAGRPVLHYRFGTPAKPAMSYPAAPVAARDAFTADTLMFSGGGGAYLRFDSGGLRYTVFTAIGRWGPDGGAAEASGVAVSRDGREAENLPCLHPPQSDLGPRLFGTLGLPPGDGFDIPDAFLPR